MRRSASYPVHQDLHIDPTWIFGTSEEGVDESGMQIAGAAVFYLFGKPMRGLWLKGYGAYERYEVTTYLREDAQAMRALLPQQGLRMVP